MKTPRVTILMSVYNGEKYLKEAIESILSQTFSDFEFLIIDDASTDTSKAIINSFNDSRIKLLEHEKNIGLTKSLNEGLFLAQGEYIARMDADDISLPKRLETQVNFMEKNPQIGLVGTWAKIIGKKNKKYIKTYAHFEKIKATILFKNVLVHPSVMFRKVFFQKHNLTYNENLKYSQDYELWTRAIKHFPISNIKKNLLLYRIHEKGVSHEHSETQVKNSNETRIRQLQNLKIMPSETEKEIHLNTYKPTHYETIDFLNKKEAWLLKLIKQNEHIKYCEEPQFSMIVAREWLLVCSVNANYDFKIFNIFWKSDLKKKLDCSDIENWKNLMRFLFKCLLKKTK